MWNALVSLKLRITNKVNFVWISMLEFSNKIPSKWCAVVTMSCSIPMRLVTFLKTGHYYHFGFTHNLPQNVPCLSSHLSIYHGDQTWLQKSTFNHIAKVWLCTLQPIHMLHTNTNTQFYIWHIQLVARFYPLFKYFVSIISYSYFLSPYTYRPLRWISICVFLTFHI